jgi:hypothetical protein
MNREFALLVLAHLARIETKLDAMIAEHDADFARWRACTLLPIPGRPH